VEEAVSGILAALLGLAVSTLVVVVGLFWWVVGRVRK